MDPEYSEKMRMKVRRRLAVVIPKYGLIGGAEGFAAAVTERIARGDNSFEVHVFAHTWQAGEEGVVFHRLPYLPFPRSLRPLLFAFFAQKAVAAVKPHIIHAHERIFSPDLYTVHGIPHLVWVREVRRKRRPSLFDLAQAHVERRMVEGGACRRFLAVSHLTRNTFLGEYRLPPAAVPVIHPGIDQRQIITGGVARERGETRRRLGVDEETYLILFASMNFAVKGLDYLIGALGRLKREGGARPFHLLVAGGDRKGPFAGLAAREGLAGQVTFVGAVSREELERFYGAADLYAMPSRFDTFGMVVLEAMAKGLPVVISKNVGARDIVREGINGFIADRPEDPLSLASVLAAALAGARRPAMREAAVETAKNHTWERTAEAVKVQYREILAAKEGEPWTSR